MKHRFLLDINVLYHAIRGVDERDNPDETAAELLALIGRNCPKIVVNAFLFDEYLRRISDLFRSKPRLLEPLVFLNQLLLKAEKLDQEAVELPTLPEGIRIPAEDEKIVRSALVSAPIIVTADRELREAINEYTAAGLVATSPREAISLAEDS